MSAKLSGKLRVWSLSDDPKEGEKYFVDHLSYRDFRRYTMVEVYNPLDDTGEQREALDRDVAVLKSKIVNRNYTPQVFNLSITDLSIVNVDEKGNVTLPLYEDNRLAIMDGGTRRKVLEILRQDEKYTKVIDQLPIEMLIYLEPEKRKQNFMNLNGGKKVNKSHIEAMKATTGLMKESKLEIFRPAMEIVNLVNTNESSPLNGKIGYGNKNETGLIQLTQVCADHKACLIASFYGAVKIINAVDKDINWYVDKFVDVYNLLKERTDYIEAGKLLAMPPDGAKGNVANLISLVNTTIYYLYLLEEMNQQGDFDHIIRCANVYNNLVNGDVSRQRRVLLSQGYGQKLFAGLDENPDVPCGFHFGLPVPLLIHTSESSFGVEKMPSLKKAK